MKNVIAHLDLKLPPFIPFFSIETSHSQTLLGHLVPSPFMTFDLRPIEIILPDGDSLYIHVNMKQNSKYIVVLFHGLAGDHQADYVLRSAKLAQLHNCSIALVDHRGVGLSADKSQYPYHSGRGEDASEVSKYLKKYYPQLKQIFIGFSMSGSILLNLATLQFGQHQPDFMIAVNPPINLKKASDLLTKNFSKIYDLRFYYRLKKMIQNKVDFKNWPLFGSTFFIDDIFTSIKSGYKDRFEYYEKCSVYSHLNNISCPTFILMSEDDPFIDFSDFEKIQWNDKTHCTFVKAGGHMGYFSKVK